LFPVGDISSTLHELRLKMLLKWQCRIAHLKVIMFRRATAVAARLKPQSESRPLAFAGLALGIALITGTIWVRPNHDGEGAARSSAASYQASTRQAITNVSTEMNHPRVVPPMPAEYKRLLNRSIFSRRSQGKPRETDGAGETVRPESQFVLRGVAVHEGNYVAFLENTMENNVIRLRNGDHVAGGKLTHLTLGGAQYDSAAGKAVILIGSALDGTVRRTHPHTKRWLGTMDDWGGGTFWPNVATG
jgi:hypothetical protein